MGYHWQKELQQAVDDLPKQQGTMGDACPYEHPFFWAAFTITGGTLP